MKVFSFGKVWFVLSLATLTFLCGFVFHAERWYPTPMLERAWWQGRLVLSSWQSKGGVNSQSVTYHGFLAPQVYDREGAQVVESQKASQEKTLITSSWKEADGWKKGLELIDGKGRTLHQWRINGEDLFQGGLFQRAEVKQSDIQGTYIFQNGDVLINLLWFGMARIDACGRVIWKLSEGNHHSIERAADGSFWTPGISKKPLSKSVAYPDGFPGLQGTSVWVDKILHVTEDGKVVNSINVLDVLYANDLERYIAKPTGVRINLENLKKDITHLNDVEPLSPSMAEEYPLFDAGDLMVSLRRLNLVFVFDPKTKEVKWHASDPFIHQHDPDFMGDGWIGVFDNNEDFTERGTMLGGSRIVALQPHTDSMKVLFPTQRSDPFYTNVRGKWQQLGNGNLLLTESQAGRAVEVAPDGSTVWEWVHKPTENSQVPSVTKATRYNMTPEQINSWDCSPTDSTRYAHNQPQ